MSVGVCFIYYSIKTSYDTFEIWASSQENLSSGFPKKASFKSVSSATETSQKIEISPVASLHMILYIKRITKALIRLCGCTG